MRQQALHTQHCNCFVLRSRSSSLRSRTLPVGPASYFPGPHHFAPSERYTAISISASPPSRNRCHLLGLTASCSLAAHHLRLYLLHVKLCCPSPSNLAIFPTSSPPILALPASHCPSNPRSSIRTIVGASPNKLRPPQFSSDAIICIPDRHCFRADLSRADPRGLHRSRDGQGDPGRL